MFSDDRLHLVERDAAGLRDACGLDLGVARADVRVEAGRGPVTASAGIGVLAGRSAALFVVNALIS